MDRFNIVCKEVTSKNYNDLNVSLQKSFRDFYYEEGINDLSEDIFKENFKYFLGDWNDWLLK